MEAQQEHGGDDLGSLTVKRAPRIANERRDTQRRHDQEQAKHHELHRGVPDDDERAAQ